MSSRDLLLAENAQGILYLEGNTDFDLLRVWANILEHPIKEWFGDLPFWHNNQGRDPKEARNHYFSLKAVCSDIEAVLLLDGDNRDLPDHEITAEGLTVTRWTRYEAESYLLHPDSLYRFISNEKGELFANAAIEFLKEQLPPAFFNAPLEVSTVLKAEPASKTLLPELLSRAGVNLQKSDYFLIAEQMNSNEIPIEVNEKLSLIYSVVCKESKSNPVL